MGVDILHCLAGRKACLLAVQERKRGGNLVWLVDGDGGQRFAVQYAVVSAP